MYACVPHLFAPMQRTRATASREARGARPANRRAARLIASTRAQPRDHVRARTAAAADERIERLQPDLALAARRGAVGLCAPRFR